MTTSCRTVAELIEALKALPPDTVPISLDPPFAGVEIVPQEDGRSVLLAPIHVAPMAAEAEALTVTH